MTDSDIAFYTREGDNYMATGWAKSPWNDKAQMGVGLAGLATHCLAQVTSPGPMNTARLVIDIQGAVPMIPLTAVSRILREGQRIQLVETTLESEGKVWVRASALRIRSEETPEVASPPSRPFPKEKARRLDSGQVAWTDTILLEGGFDQTGPGARWVRLTSSVVAGEPLRPLEALAMVADFGSGTATLLSPKAWSQANIDITLHLSRPPRGEWILIDSKSESAGNGHGIVHSQMSDLEGAIGMSHQTIFVNPR